MTSAQLAHDVVTTLGFGFILVATSDNATTLCFRRRYYDQKLKLLKRCVFEVGFPNLVLMLQQRRDSVSFSWRKSKGIPISL